MEKSHKIALLSAGLLIGAQVGATVLTTETSGAALPEPIAAEALPDTATPAEAASETTTSEAPAPAPDAVVAVEAQPIMPVTPRRIEAQASYLGPWGEDQPMLPSLVAYLDRTEHLRVTGAPGSAFPDEAPMLPSLVAYLEQRDRTRIAQAQPPVAAEPVASAAVATEVTLLETR
jgi:hypothetical protein